MANDNRTPGKYGRVSPDRERKVLMLERYLSPREPLKLSGLPAVGLDQDVDRASKVKDWPMYLNDQIGDCTIAGAAHMFGALSEYGQGKEALFRNSVIEHTYSAIGGYVPGQPDTDQGCMMSDVLDYLRKTGMQDSAGKIHKVAGAAEFGDPTDLELLGQVLDAGGTVYTGINCQAVIQREFQENKPFTWQKNGEVEGGHCIVLQRRKPQSTASAGVLDYVTWGALASATTGFQAHAVEEAWFVVSEDWVDAKGSSVEGLDLQQLLSDMQYV